MSRKPYIIANWKMNLDSSAVDRFFGSFDLTHDAVQQSHVIFAPSFVQIPRVHTAVVESSAAVAAQDMYWEDAGAFTGEVSAPQIKGEGCDYVILGHSERRALFNETDEEVRAKLSAALHHRIQPIVCFGESHAQKEAGETKEVIRQKVTSIFSDLRAAEARKVLLAYEPLWAISTSTDVENPEPDTPESAQVVHKLIRRVVGELYDEHVAEEIPVLYGGSVNPDNVASFAAMEDIDGVLVGGASKAAGSFQKIIDQCVSTT